ncbi:MAG: OmpH family outer membrane protein [Pseudoflavonifractor sp.]|nr:OmpH family outer membrane protein [Alloprevotella sp.]MCM1116468.1 OmpH family outer membrane protein [Pseudoflavonifractor sp.]
MLRHFIIAILALLPTMTFAQRLATVDMVAVKAGMPEVEQMQAAIDAASKKYEAEFSNLREKFQKELTDFQALPPDTPNSIKERRAQEIQELNQKMQQFVTDAQAELQEMQQGLMAPINSRIKQAIATVAREGGYALVLDSTQPLFIEAVDVTSQVRATLGLPLR